MKGFNFEEAELHLKKDSILRPVIEAITLPARQEPSDVYLGLIRSIISQQLSVKAAKTIFTRFINLFESGYPHAELLLEMQEDTLRSVGLSRQKASYIKNVALFFKEEKLFDKDWSEVSDDEAIAKLTQIKGVGQWTVEMILMFVLSREDVLPVLDLGIQHGIKQLYGLEEEKKALHAKMKEVSESWRPYRSIACLYLWAVKDLK